MKYHKLPSVEEIVEIYYNNDLNLSDIAQTYKSSVNAVSLKLRRAGYKIKSRSSSQKGNYINLTLELEDFIEGLLLGDGSLSYAPTRKSVSYQHTDNYPDYLIWLQQRLYLFDIESKINKLSLKTRYYRNLVNLRKKWYPDGKKLVPKDFNMTPVKLYHWYIGDGNYRAGKNGTKKSRAFRIAMFFDPEGRERIMKMLEELNIYTSLQGNQIYIRARSISEFFKYIYSSGLDIPDCYKYKFPEGVVV